MPQPPNYYITLKESEKTQDYMLIIVYNLGTTLAILVEGEVATHITKLGTCLFPFMISISGKAK